MGLPTDGRRWVALPVPGAWLQFAPGVLWRGCALPVAAVPAPGVLCYVATRPLAAFT